MCVLRGTNVIVCSKWYVTWESVMRGGGVQCGYVLIKCVIIIIGRGEESGSKIRLRVLTPHLGSGLGYCWEVKSCYG